MTVHDTHSCGACLGTLVIDWHKREYEFSGMDGSGEEMTADEVRAVFAEHDCDPDVKVMALLFWPDNEQLSVHDSQGFEEEVGNYEED